MVEPTDTGHGHKSGRSCLPSLHRPLLGGVFPQSLVSFIRMIVAEVFTNQPAQMSFVEDDHMVQQFSAATPHPTFGNPVLPRTPIGRPDQFAP
jgi:hypothetical protein